MGIGYSTRVMLIGTGEKRRQRGRSGLLEKTTPGRRRARAEAGASLVCLNRS